MHDGETTQIVLATSRTLPLSPAEAQTALATCVTQFAAAFPEGSDGFRLRLPGGAVARLRPSPLSGASAQHRLLLTGTVRSRRGWRSVPVEIEAAPVSPSAVELVVRPLGAVCLHSAAHRRLFQGAGHVLADLFSVETEVGETEVTAAAAGCARRHPTAYPGRVAVPA